MYAKQNDETDFARKLIELTDDEARRKYMGDYGRRRIEEELQWSFEAPKLLEAYEILFLD